MAETQLIPAQPDINLEFNPQGQMFASRDMIRMALFDVIDAGDGGNWALYEDDPVMATDLQYAWTEDMANEERGRFTDAVINRIAELQTAPHDGIKLENLCDFHKRRALPAPTSQSCAVCEKERKVNPNG